MAKFTLAIEATTKDGNIKASYEYTTQEKARYFLNKTVNSKDIIKLHYLCYREEQE